MGQGAAPVVRLLGTCSVVSDSTPKPLSGRPAQVLATLGAVSPEWLAADRLIDLIWGDDAVETTRGAVHQVVKRLRQRLGQHADLIESSALGYRLVDDPTLVDLIAFESELIDGNRWLERGDLSQAAHHLERASSLLRGRPFDGFDDLAETGIRGRRCTEAFLSLVESIVEKEVSSARLVNRVPMLLELVEDEPYRERLWCALAASQAASGQVVEAVRSLKRLRAQLADVGMAPSANTNAIEASLFGIVKTGGRIDVEADGADLSSLRGYWPLPFRGRATALQRLSDTIGQSHGVVVVTGEAGSGKSHLVAVAARSSLDNGRRVGHHRFDPFSSLGRVAIDAERWIGSYDIIILEDLHFANSTELGEVARIALDPRHPETAVVLTGRPAEGGWDNWLGRLAPTLRPTRITVGPLTRLDIAELVTDLSPDSAHDVDRIVRLTGGSPLLVVELIKSRGIADVASSEGNDAIAAVMDARLAGIDSGRTRLLEVLAVAGGESTVDVLQSVLGLSAAELAPLVDELLHQGLIRETGAHGAVRLGHDLLRLAVERRLPAVTRDALGSAIGQAMSDSGRSLNDRELRSVLGGSPDAVAAARAALELAETALDRRLWSQAVELARHADVRLDDPSQLGRMTTDPGQTDPDQSVDRLRTRAALLVAHGSEALNRIDDVRNWVAIALRRAVESTDWSNALRAAKLSLLALSPGEPNDAVRRLLHDTDLLDALGAAPTTPQHGVAALEAVCAVHDGTDPDPDVGNGAGDRIGHIHDRLVSDGLDTAPELIELVTQCRLLAGQGLPDQELQLKWSNWRVSYHAQPGSEQLNSVFHRLPRLLATGQRSQVERDLDVLVDGAARLDHRDYLTVSSQVRAALAVADGRLADAQQHLAAADLLIEDHAVHQTIAMVQHWWLAQLDDPHPLVAIAQQAADDNLHRPSMQAIAAFTHIRADDLDAARRSFDRVIRPDGTLRLPVDVTFPATTAALLEVAARLGDPALLHATLDALRPFEGQLVFAVGFAIAFGSADRSLALGEAALGNHDLAQKLFDSAERIERNFGADLLVASTLEARSTLRL